MKFKKHQGVDALMLKQLILQQTSHDYLWRALKSHHRFVILGSHCTKKP